jgi:hypothetical protein
MAGFLGVRHAEWAVPAWPDIDAEVYMFIGDGLYKGIAGNGTGEIKQIEATLPPIPTDGGYTFLSSLEEQGRVEIVAEGGEPYLHFHYRSDDGGLAFGETDNQFSALGVQIQTGAGRHWAASDTAIFEAINFGEYVERVAAPPDPPPGDPGPQAIDTFLVTPTEIYFVTIPLEE